MSISSYLALIIIVIIVNVVKSAQKKKEAEEARRMPTAKAQPIMPKTLNNSFLRSVPTTLPSC